MDAGLYGLPREVPSPAPPPPEEVRARLERLPRSAQAVYDLLARRGPLTHKDLVRSAGMPPRTVRYALQRLRHEGVIGAYCNLMDCRQCYFYAEGLCDGRGVGGLPLRVRGG